MSLTPSELITRLTSWFLRRDRDITLPSGRGIFITGANVEITTGGIVITGGNITIDGTVDGVDISAHAADTDGHHARSHALDSGSDHTGSLPWGDLNKSGSDLADLATRAHSSLTGVTSDLHHNESHTVASHSDTSGTGSELNTLTDGSDASSLHDHDGRYFQESEFSQNHGAASGPLETSVTGAIQLTVLVTSDDARIGGGVTVGDSTTNSPDGIITFKEVSGTPSTPSSGYGIVWINASGQLYWKDDAGDLHQVAEV